MLLKTIQMKKKSKLPINNAWDRNDGLQLTICDMLSLSPLVIASIKPTMDNKLNPAVLDHSTLVR
jgi:hypothetical protein